MVVTNESRKRRRPRGERRDRQTAAQAAEPQPTPAAADRERPKRPEPPRIRGRAAVSRIRHLAALSDLVPNRTRLRQLAKQVADGADDAQRVTLIEGAIAECVDEAPGIAPREKWLACEAASWALAWIARTKRAGGSAGGLLERLVREARVAETDLRAGDTRGATFVVTLARLFADIEACRCLEATAAAALADEIGRLVSAEGGVGVGSGAAMVERVVRWTESRAVALATGPACWDDQTESRWAVAAATALRLLGSDGRVVTAPGCLPASFTVTLLDAVSGRSAPAGKPARRTARAFRGEAAATARLAPRDLHDRAAAIAILRSGWQRGGVRVLVAYRDAVPRLEIAIDDRVLFEGPWAWSVEQGGRPLEAEGPWTVSAWESDDKASFLELTAPLTGGMQLERQLVLVPRDSILVLADAVTMRADAGSRPDPTAELAYQGTVPLAAGLEVDAAEETRELFVYDTSMRCLALPLALPEWRSAAAGGVFETDAAGLTLRQRGRGGRLYAPVWLDLRPRRIGKPLTWRQLTVADTRINLPRHQAVGFRVQCGREQWLLYKSLDEPRNRSLLGCNVSADFLLGRIPLSGEVKRTIEIQ